MCDKLLLLTGTGGGGVGGFRHALGLAGSEKAGVGSVSDGGIRGRLKLLSVAVGDLVPFILTSSA